jgi:hypothetical protein
LVILTESWDAERFNPTRTDMAYIPRMGFRVLLRINFLPRLSHISFQANKAMLG